ncbi:asparagine synthetase domain-containing protein 1 [Dioscorea cayenensis subsp. rotundata]|uniref:Asparagine synthetase domain-containing protein 1 n=1 Tax=Dioscorea cayennensis subsp. rotundata TaxID=55577 RepID=A0AB40BVN9_DIOCR|nr:asparagine synthetase domain-containing protein 1 [Dioscorea cayenensis subsp. rotundata]
MCGIALILSGVRIIGSEVFGESSGARCSDSEEVPGAVLEIDDLIDSLLRRGPDNLGSKRIFLQLKPSSFQDDYGSKGNGICIPLEHCDVNNTTSVLKAVCAQDDAGGVKSVADLYFLGATLQLRGAGPISQPLVDTCGNLLVYNGEIFGGVHVDADSNDAETLLHELERCYSCNCQGHGKNCSCSGKGERSIPEVLSTIKGPWSLIYWQERSKTIWFGRDAFGRRSLLVHWPTNDDSRFVLSSVSPPSSVGNIYGSVAGDTFSYWEELPCGIYSINLEASKSREHSIHENLNGKIEKHEWTDAELIKIIKWERAFLDPKLVEVHLYNYQHVVKQCALAYSVGDMGDHVNKQTESAYKVLNVLRQSVMQHTALSMVYQASLRQAGEKDLAPIAILFSGGLDSMILAALLDQCIDSSYTIDLLNVSFDGNLAPDRVSAWVGIRELRRIAPLRRWRLVEIDASLSDLALETKHVMSLIHPLKTYMDLNIGTALWLAAGGDGWVDENINPNCREGHCRYKYKSKARILLVGSGADEQCAGYGRHRTKYRAGGWLALHNEMRLDMQRIWKRNLGRDDRCISDHGKEARFPFLDEDVIRTLLEIPLWEITNLDEPVGKGDKKILREVAKLLGLESAALLPKRAIQFGSRIARESNRKNFGSNRAANQASAGSVEIHE